MTYKVAILMGSPNDREKMQPAADTRVMPWLARFAQLDLQNGFAARF